MMTTDGARLRAITERLNDPVEPWISIEDGKWLCEFVKKVDHAICWETTCIESARLLDSLYDQYEQIRELKKQVTKDSIGTLPC